MKVGCWFHSNLAPAEKPQAVNTLTDTLHCICSVTEPGVVQLLLMVLPLLLSIPASGQVLTCMAAHSEQRESMAEALHNQQC